MEADTAVRQIVRECGFNCRGQTSNGIPIRSNILEIFRWLGPDDMCVTEIMGFLRIEGATIKLYGKGEREEYRGVMIAQVSLYDPNSIPELKKHLLRLMKFDY
jgi:hypothetical protein